MEGVFLLKLRNLLLISASIFLFLSLLGIIGSNSFLTIIKRSFLGTVILSLLIAGAVHIIRKIISGIPASDAEGKQYDQNVTPDSRPNVDILLDKENPFETEGEDIFSGDGDVPLKAAKKTNESTSAENLVEEVEEDTLDDINSLDINTNDNEVIEVMDDNIDGGGDLLDVDSGDDLFGTKDTLANRKAAEALNSLGENVNPQTMAKAIKTVITRDDNKG